MSDTQTTRITPKDLRGDADNIAHSNRGIYPVGPLLDAAAEIERLSEAVKFEPSLLRVWTVMVRHLRRALLGGEMERAERLTLALDAMEAEWPDIFTAEVLENGAKNNET